MRRIRGAASRARTPFVMRSTIFLHSLLPLHPRAPVPFPNDHLRQPNAGQRTHPCGAKGVTWGKGKRVAVSAARRHENAAHCSIRGHSPPANRVHAGRVDQQVVLNKCNVATTGSITNVPLPPNAQLQQKEGAGEQHAVGSSGVTAPQGARVHQWQSCGCARQQSALAGRNSKASSVWCSAASPWQLQQWPSPLLLKPAASCQLL